MEFKLLEQNKDENSSPTFCYQVILEDIKAGIGKGFSKKESQQLASKETLQRLRRELGHGGGDPLTHLPAGGPDVQGAVLVHFHDAGGGGGGCPSAC